MSANGSHPHNDPQAESSDETLALTPRADPHHRSFYLPDHSAFLSFLPSSLRSGLSTHRGPLLLVVLLVAAILLLWPHHTAFTGLDVSALMDNGGATSGKEVNLYRQRAASSYPLPSSVNLTPFPSLSNLLVGRTAPGLLTLLRCIERSGGRLAVMTSISPNPTAAEVGLALLTQPWCTVVIGDKKGPAHAAFTAAAAVSMGVNAYLDKMTLTGQDSTPPLSQIDSADVMTRIAYIDVAEQALLPYALSALTPYGSFSRKNLGFLLAFHSGASVIFDVDDDNIYLPNTALTGNADLPVDLRPLHYASSASLDHRPRGKVLLDHSAVRALPPGKGELEPVNVSVFNPYPLYGAEDAWPRGFPLTWVRPTLRDDGHYDAHCLSATRYCSAVVQQWLANQDPDVDAIYRLTNSKGMPFSFLAPGRTMTRPGDAVASPAVALPAHTFTPFNAQATIITPGAFFAMLLPSTVHGRVSDIWRSYIVETLLTYYTLDHRSPSPVKVVKTSAAAPPAERPSSAEPCVVFTPPRIFHDRNAHNYQLDFNSEQPLYTTAEALVSWLSVRQRGGAKDLLGRLGARALKADPERVMADVMWWLYVELYEAAVVEEAELAYVQAWLSDIARISARPRLSKQQGKAVEQEAKPEGEKCFPSYHNRQ